jgi:hypothetical protein
LGYKLVEGIDVELAGCYMNRRLAIIVSQIRVGLAKLNERLNDKGIASEDCLVQGQPCPAVNARLSLLKQEVENVEV